MLADLAAPLIVPLASPLDYLRDSELLINTLLENFGGWMVGIVALIVFIESGVLFPVLPGDSLVFTLGILHHRIPVPLMITLVVLVIAAILGNTVGYWLGSRFGRGLFRPGARFLSTANLAKAEEFFARYGGRALLLARFVPFVRTFVPIVAGIARFRYPSFLVWNIAGALVWVGGFLIAGELLGSIPVIAHNIELIAIIIVAFSVLPVAVGAIRARRTGRTER
ncbi:DedA family protein [Nanchangia anserum]|uniref:DedA family protein n=1 Tax=Nanchangia anserum TaxID=2692125 RepID=UPI001D10E545|nr:VTT domain-containing protein [Nanchangia anserum]